MLKEGWRKGGLGSLFIFDISVLSCLPVRKSFSASLRGGRGLSTLEVDKFCITPSLSNTSAARASSASSFTGWPVNYSKNDSIRRGV